MVKTLIKSIVSRSPIIKRVRGIRARIRLNKARKNFQRKVKRIQSKPKPFDINYYLNSKVNILLSQEEKILNRLRGIEDSEYRETRSRNREIYEKIDREFALFGLKDMIYQILEASPNKDNIFPDNFAPSVISLVDYYLKNAQKKLTKSQLIKVLYSSLLIIDKEKNIGVFNKSLLNNFELKVDFFDVVDCNLYPIKVFDYFEIFFLRISQMNKEDTKHQEYVKLFKKVFIEIDYYLNFNENSKIYRPYDKFIYCLLMTQSFLKNNNFLQDGIVDLFIEYYKNKTQYDEFIYLLCCNYVKESKYSHDNLVYSLNVHNLFREEIIGINNLNCI